MAYQAFSVTQEVLQGEGVFAANGSSMAAYGDLDAWFGSGGNTARVFHSRDGGITWEVTNTPFCSEYYSGSAKIERTVSNVIISVIGCKGDATKPRDK
jgi:hypothetical protein